MISVSEQVSAGHPDKIADQISDALLDAYLKKDPNSRCAIETGVKGNTVMVFGEVSSDAGVNHQEIAEEIFKKHTAPWNPHYEKRIEFINRLGVQSPDIAMGVNTGGAGDQGIMVGYATSETEEMLPYPYLVATRVLEKLDQWAAELDFLGPDRKSQMVVDYDSGSVVELLLSTQHENKIERKLLEEVVTEAWYSALNTTKSNFQNFKITSDTRLLINPTGNFVIGGPQGDAGLTGRKIIADTYGSAATHGGGAFSGKDPSKVDRSASYAARWVAKQIVNEGLAREVEVIVSYSIGLAQPLSVEVKGVFTGSNSEFEALELANAFDWAPSSIIKQFKLQRPMYEEFSTYGHFTHQQAPWECL